MIFKMCYKQFTLFAVIAAILSPASGVAADDAFMRAGEVFEVAREGIWTWVGARDSDDEVFCVMITNCTVGVGGIIEVIKGNLYQKLKVESLDKVFENCYEGTLIRVNGQEFRAYGVHGLPDGCIDLGGGLK